MASVREVSFSYEGQTQFASLSGDWNPLHTDATVARRLVFGGLAVHGVHLLLHALRQVLATDSDGVELQSLRAQFLSPVAPGDRVRFEQSAHGGGLRVVASVAGTRAAQFDFDFDAAVDRRSPIVDNGVPERETPSVENVETLEAQAGRVPLHWDSDLAAQLDCAPPNTAWMPLFAALLATTRIVGMKVPGLHSVFSELSLDLASGFGRRDDVGFNVEAVDRRFNLVRIGLDVAGASGLIKAFVRPAPIEQASVASLQDLVPPDQFGDETALIVGGSRGLGEVAAKLLAAGGAKVTLTYRSGQDDASRVVTDIRSQGGRAVCRQLDVSDLCDDDLAWLQSLRSQRVLYMATPRIFGEKGSRFAPDHFAVFERVYLHGFLQLFYAAQAAGTLRQVLYPSSVAVDNYERQLFEYGIAKAAGEQACHFLASMHKDVEFLVPRLPRLATDQTASLTGTPGEDPVRFLLNLLR
ncbi:MAG: SDR family NAD(P)-dependent oxidoreductase [Pseudomonadota bacterium]